MCYAIVCTTDHVARYVLFHWTRDAEAGIARARREAAEFGMHDFRAERLED